MAKKGKSKSKSKVKSKSKSKTKVKSIPTVGVTLKKISTRSVKPILFGVLLFLGAVAIVVAALLGLFENLFDDIIRLFKPNKPNKPNMWVRSVNLANSRYQECQKFNYENHEPGDNTQFQCKYGPDGTVDCSEAFTNCNKKIIPMPQ